jgi:hypothetical protein
LAVALHERDATGLRASGAALIIVAKAAVGAAAAAFKAYGTATGQCAKLLGTSTFNSDLVELRPAAVAVRALLLLLAAQSPALPAPRSEGALRLAAGRLLKKPQLGDAAVHHAGVVATGAC